MVRSFIPAAVAAAILSTMAPSARAGGVTPEEQQTILSLHNSYRAQHCVPPVTWSNELAAAAQKYAEGCWIAHDGKKGKVGENLAWGGDRTAASAVDAWYKEIEDYDYKKPGFASATGHFTLMVWKGVKQVGCGVATCYFGAIRYWVCRYTPQGNWAGQFPQNVPPRCK